MDTLVKEILLTPVTETSGTFKEDEYANTTDCRARLATTTLDSTSRKGLAVAAEVMLNETRDKFA
jgi:hypothetical protein